MKYLFEENQKFTQWWLWVILLSFPIISFGPFDENTININYVLIGFFIPFLFYLFELRLKVSAEGLHYQFFPFHLKSHIIKLKDIEKFKANQALEYDLLNIRYESEVEMYQMMIDTRDQQIKKDKKRDVWQRWATYGAFVLGAGTTVAITYSVNQAAN